jgi:hypothetical protein
MKKFFAVIVVLFLMFVLIGCESLPGDSSNNDAQDTLNIGDELAKNQPTPTDIEYSLERLNLIARAYWVNGQRDKALTILNTSPVPLPLGYIVLISGNVIVGQFTVMGKVSSLNSWLTPDYWYDDVAYTDNADELVEMPDVDGTYGTNADGVFFFTTDGKYMEWTGTYLYSDMYLPVENPIINVGGGE